MEVLSIIWSSCISECPAAVPPPDVLSRARPLRFRKDRITQTDIDGTSDSRPDMRTELSWGSYLVRLPSQAEAQRLVREWNATEPSWGGMLGEWTIRAEIVW